MTDIPVLNRFVVRPNLPLPLYDLPWAKAFYAEGLKGGQELMGFVTGVFPQPRLDAVNTFLKLSHRSISRFYGVESIPWPTPESEKQFVFIYGRPKGPRVCSYTAPTFAKLSEDFLLASLPSLLEGLENLYKLGVAHRNIRPDNLYINQEEANHLILGEALTAPAGYAQPLFCEPLERSICDPFSRGKGELADDIYAIGATFYALFLGEIPNVSLSKEEFFDLRIQKGSYSSLTLGRPLPKRMVDFLMGTLTDNVKERWSFEDTLRWAQHHHKLSISTRLPEKSVHSFAFQNKSYMHMANIAYALNSQHDKAVQTLVDMRFDEWAKTGVKEPERFKLIVEIFSLTKNALLIDPSERDNFLCHLCLVLDPQGPLYWRGETYMLDGLGGTLASLVLQAKPTKDIEDLIHVVAHLYKEEPILHNHPRWKPLRLFFEVASHTLRRKEMGFGLARVLYMLNPKLFCLSPKFLPQLIFEADTALSKIDLSIAHHDIINETNFLDTYLISFLAETFRSVGDRDIASLSLSGALKIDQIKKTSAILQFFKQIQEASPHQSLRHLASWLLKMSAPLIQEYKNKKNRETIIQSAQEQAEKGNIVALCSILDNPNRLAREQHEFFQAKIYYYRLKMAIEKEKNTVLKNPAYGAKNAKAMAFYISLTATVIFQTLIGLLYIVCT